MCNQFVSLKPQMLGQKRRKQSCTPCILYTQQLERVHGKLKTFEPALVNRRGFILLQENPKSVVAKDTRDRTIRLGYETLVHPPYSLTLYLLITICSMC